MAASVTLKDVSQKLRMVKPKTPEGEGVSTAAYQTTRVTALENGINLNRPDGGLILYTDMSMLVTFQLDNDPETWYLDVFVYGNPGAFRISQKAINYRQFLPELAQRSKDNFFAFLLHLIDHTDSIYIDDHTLEFLKTQKIISFPDFKFVENYTRQLWFQVVAWMKFACELCGEIYWVDDAKISDQGAKTKCVKCQNVITVKKRGKPMPLQPKDDRKKLVCPHCQYENVEGAQFCVMCQNPLTTIKPKPAPKRDKRSEERPSEPPTAPPETPAAPPVEDQSTMAPQETPPDSAIPLQGRGQRKPRLPFHELEQSLQEDMTTLKDHFAWFTQFALILKIVGFVFLVGGILLGAYIYFAAPNPKPPAIITTAQRFMYAGISSGVGFLLFLFSLATSNLVTATIFIERNTRTTMILLHKLVEAREE